MEVTEMFFAANWIRDYCCSFNRSYRRQDIKIEKDLLTSYMKKIYTIGISDASYWQDTKIDFQTIYNQIAEVERAEKEKDYAYLYDKLNGELWRIAGDILETLFHKSAEDLKGHFWKINCEALQKRNPEALQKLKELHKETHEECIRPYGLRGEVVYAKNREEEFDLYSAQCPDELGIRTAEKLEIERYRKIYVWGYNGGFEISGLFLLEGQYTQIEIYVTDLKLCERILSNVYRRWLIINPKVSWKFEVSMDEFLNSIDLREKNDIYILVGERYGSELEKLKEFIDRTEINSNIESFFYKKEELFYG